MPLSHLDIVTAALRHEAAGIISVAERLDDSVNATVDRLLACEGRLICTGMGKMGAIARKAAATFCSTGTPAIFLHPAEAVHGDLGVVTSADVLVALSYSGETDELKALLPFVRRFDIPVVALTGNRDSALARHSQHVIAVTVDEEADPISMAPTTSTTVALAVCDALAVALMTRRGFTADQFAIFHPGGQLGRKMLLTVGQLMKTGDRIPRCGRDCSLATAIVTISQKGLGAALVVDPEDRLEGIFTDGDLRRTFAKSDNPLRDPVGEWMTEDPLSIHAEALAAEALRLMENRNITVLPVVAEGRRVQGIIHLHDLVSAGLA